MYVSSIFNTIYPFTVYSIQNTFDIKWTKVCFYSYICTKFEHATTHTEIQRGMCTVLNHRCSKDILVITLDQRKYTYYSNFQMSHFKESVFMHLLIGPLWKIHFNHIVWTGKTHSTNRSTGHMVMTLWIAHCRRF